MPNWRRIIVGDAFKLPSRDLNYYRDLALVGPWLVFSIASLMQGFSHSRSPEDTLFFHRALVGAIICLLLAKEKLLFIVGALAIVLWRGLLLLIALYDWRLALLLLLAGAVGIGVAIVKERAGWRPSYDLPNGVTVVDVLIFAVSLSLSLTFALWMQTCLPVKFF